MTNERAITLAITALNSRFITQQRSIDRIVHMMELGESYHTADDRQHGKEQIERLRQGIKADLDAIDTLDQLRQLADHIDVLTIEA